MKLGRISTSPLTRNSLFSSLTNRNYLGRGYSLHNPKSDFLTTIQKIRLVWNISMASGLFGGGIWGFYEGMKEPFPSNLRKDLKIWEYGLVRTVLTALKVAEYGGMGLVNGIFFHLPIFIGKFE